VKDKDRVKKTAKMRKAAATEGLRKKGEKTHAKRKEIRGKRKERSM